MNVNERLTEVARNAARGVTRSAFNNLNPESQKMLIEWIVGQPALTEEIVRSYLIASNDADIGDLLAEAGQARDLHGDPVDPDNDPQREPIELTGIKH